MVGEVWLLLFASVFHRFAVNGFPGSQERVLLHRLHRSAEDEDRDVESYQSDREVPRDVPTRPDYTGKGHWSKGSLPNGKEVDVGFVPQKIYTQVRKYDTVKHLPRSAAADEATTYEEKVNAPRLREVLSQKKIQQVYEEEGYEDMGYDHGGYNHHGSKYEDKEKNEDLTVKKPIRDNDSGSAEQVAVVAGQPNSTAKPGSTPIAVRWKRFHTETQTKKMSFGDESGEGKTKSVVEEIDDVTRPFVKEREPVTVKSDINGTVGGDDDSSVAASVAEDTQIAKDESKGDSGSIEARDGDLDIDVFETAESHNSHSAIREQPTGRSMEARVVNDPRPKGSSVVTFPGRHTRRQYAVGRPLDVYVQESVGFNVKRPVYGLSASPVTTNVHHYLPYMPAFPSYYSDNPAAFTAQVISQRLPVKHEIVSEPTTTASPTTTVSVTDTLPVKFLNAADTLNAYANLLQQAATTSSSKPVSEPEQNYADLIQPRFNSSLDVDISASTRAEKHSNATATRRRPSKFRHPVSNGRGRFYNNFTRTGINPSSEMVPNSQVTLELKNPSPHTRHPSLPRDSSEDVSHDTPYAAAHAFSVIQGPPYAMHRPQDPVKYIESLTVAHFANGANVPHSPPSVQNERLRELARQLNAHSENVSRRKRLGTSRSKRHTDEIEYDHEKYPFYDSYKGISRDSALRYASNPDDVPKKSSGGMEFYEARDRQVKCDEPQEPADVTPEKDEDGEWNDNPQPQNMPRMTSLGDSIDCMKLKYFGRDPLDNPFFKEGPIGDPTTYGLDGTIKDYVKTRERKVRSIDATDRVMIIPSRQDNSTIVYNHNYTNSDHIRGEERSNGHSTFPYKNHKPESALVSPSVYNLRVTSPYRYYSEQDDSYFPNYDPHNVAQDSDSEDSKRHKYYHHNYKHKYVHEKKKRVRPPSHYYPRPRPVSIYSVIAASKSHPMIRRPIVYSSGSHVIPVYHQDSGPVNDNYISDSKNVYQTTPTRWYIVRPGEYTENKDIATDSKTSGSSIWNYINPLRWWFPAYFDERRGEPKHRRRRSTIHQQEQELFNRILARTNNATLQSRVLDTYKTPSPDVMRNHQESTTGRPISINEFKARLNASSERLGKAQSKLNRLTGGFVSRNGMSSTTPSYTNTISSPSYGEDSYGVVVPSTTPMSPSSVESNPTTVKPKVLFPRTRTPARRKPQPPKTNVNSVNKNSLTTTTSTTTTTMTPSTTTRMYKPKRVVKKKFDKHIPVEAFPVLRRSSKPATSSPFDSVESSAAESSSMEEPRRLQQVEHRRVTKEEVYKTSYVPEEERRINRNTGDSLENYSMSSSDSSPVTGPTMDTDNHTLTYMVNPVTGVGSWGEQPRRTTWRPKRKYPKRHLDGKQGYRSTYTYPHVGYSLDAMEQESKLSRNRKRHSGVPHYDSQAYITGLMNQVYPKSELTSASRTTSWRGSRKSASLAPSSFEDSSSSSDNSSGSRAEGGSEENYPPPTKSPPKFILDPGKRKYFYVRTR